MRSTCPNHTRPAGFSLLELIVVLTLLAIMTAVVVPAFNGSVGSVHADHTVRDLVALMKFAQERAITDTTEYRLYLAPMARRYWLARQEQNDLGELVFKELLERAAEPRVLPQNVDMKTPKAVEDREQGAYYIRFYPSGACDVASVELVRRDERSSVKIETMGKVGRIEVSE